MYFANNSIAEDEEDDRVPVPEQKTNAPHIAEIQQCASIPEYVKCHTEAQTAIQKRKAVKQSIAKEMERHNQAVVGCGEHFFVKKSGGREKTKWTPEFLAKGFVRYLRDKKQANVADHEGEEFVAYLELARDSHAKPKKPCIRYQNKRPPEAYFG